jgi:uncharacterized NAD-dependent epimerase/dehydratase family protein
VAPVACVIDRAHAGGDLVALTGIERARGVPIVATVAEAVALGADVLIPAVAPTGGALPPEWVADLRAALSAGLSVAAGLHTPLASHPDLAPLVTRPGQYVWDIRQEPPGLVNGWGRAREMACRRVLFVGTDMAVGKMTAALEAHREALARGVRSKFLATGQCGIAIAGEGVPLDAVRVDFASGSVEAEALRLGAEGCDVLFVEGQGSLLNPASTATLPLLRGAMPTHLVLCHRAGQEAIKRATWARIPPLPDVIRLYEAVSAAAGALEPAAKAVAVSLNTAHIPDDAEARREVERAAEETGLPATDPVRFSAAPLVDAVSA